MEERANKEKEDEEAEKRWRRAVEDQKRMAELAAEEEEEEDGYEPTTDEDGYEPTTDVRRGVLLPGEGPLPDTQTAIDADGLRDDQKPAGSSKNSNDCGR